MAYSSTGAYGNPFDEAPSGSSGGASGSAYYDDSSRAAYDMRPASSSAAAPAAAPRAPPAPVSRSLNMGAWGDGPLAGPEEDYPPPVPVAQPRPSSSSSTRGSSKAPGRDKDGDRDREREREEAEAAEGRLAARRAAARARAERERAREERERARAELLGRGAGPGPGRRASETGETGYGYGYDYEVDEDTERRASRHARAEWVKERARQQRAGRLGAFEDRPSFDDDDSSEASKVRAMSQEERKARSNMEVLNSSIRVASQANATGADTLLTLERQREQMQRIDGNLAEINDQLTASERILRGMKSWGGAIANVFTRAPAPKPEKNTYKGSGPQHTAAPLPASRQQQQQATMGRPAAGAGAGGKAAVPASSRPVGPNASSRATSHGGAATETARSTEEEEIRRRREELERKRQEAEAEEDAALDTLGDLMQNLKYQAEAMNKELVWGSDMLDHISAETDRANRRIKQSTRTIREIR